MTAMAGPRKTISIHDYPEHLNPFREEDNHSRIRFWTIGRKLSRSNSITFSGLKDLRNSWSLRSFMRKGKKSEQAPVNKHANQGDGESPIMFRRALQYASVSAARGSVGSERGRYEYGGSVTPLPRSRFQERLRNSQHELNSLSVTPRMARSEITGSRLSVVSTNPFDEEAPVPPARSSRRKKQRAPPPPTASTADTSAASTADTSVTSDSLDLSVTEVGDVNKTNISVDDEMDDMNLKIELKIVEDEDHNSKEINQKVPNVSSTEVEIIQISSESDQAKEKTEISENDKSDDETVELRHKPEVEMEESKVSFPKVDIFKYRRNSSVNEDEIRLRRDDLENYHPLSNKRSKSLTNNLSGETYITYDINLNESKTFDINSNEEPQKVVCKIYEESRKTSVDNSISSTEKEFLEIDKATRELEREISKLNSALIEDDFTPDSSRLSVSQIRQKFDKSEVNSPNPIPKPRRSNQETNLRINGNL